MKKHLLILMALFLLVLPLYADVDTKDGTAITTATDIDGSSDAHDVADGQTITSGGITPDLINQNFETATTGYDNGETWNEAGTVEAAFGVGGVTGEPANWLTQCLQIAGIDTTERRTAHDMGADKAITYTRLEVIFSAFDGTAGPWLRIIAKGMDSNPLEAWQLYLHRTAGGDYKFLTYHYSSGGSSAGEDFGTDNLATNTMYRVEIKYDATNELFEWKVDGDSEGSQGLVAAFLAGVQHLFLGSDNASARTYTLHYDRVGVHSTEWIGD